MIKRFLLAWGLYWLAVLLMPVSSIYQSVAGAFVLQLGFVIIVAGVIYAGSRLLKLKEPLISDVSRIQYARTISWVSVLLSIIGLCLLMYDKIFIQGIDYTKGISWARYQWSLLGEARLGKPSSVFSALGYLLGSFYFVTAVIVVTPQKNIPFIERTLLLGLCFCLLIANSMLTGGRSSVLLLAVFVISSFAVYSKSPWRDLFSTKLRGLMAGCLGLAVVIYMVYVFYEHANGRGFGMVEYSLSTYQFLGLEASPWFLKFISEDFLGEIAAVFVLFITYITHSFSTTAAIIDTSVTEHSIIIFIHAANLLYKLGWISQPDGGWFLSGRMLSLPGSLWLQFGLFGFVASSIIIGLVSAFSKVWFSVRRNQVLALGFYTSTEAVLILSPALFAGDFMSFPFVVFAFIVTAAVLNAVTLWRKNMNKSNNEKLI